MNKVHSSRLNSSPNGVPDKTTADHSLISYQMTTDDVYMWEGDDTLECILQTLWEMRKRKHKKCR